MIWMLKPLVLSLGITILTELAVGWAWNHKTKQDAQTIVLVNIITNPPLNFALMVCALFFDEPTILHMEAAAELGVWLLEAFLYKKYLKNCRHPNLFSLTANGASYIMGLLIHYILFF